MPLSLEQYAEAKKLDVELLKQVKLSDGEHNGQQCVLLPYFDIEGKHLFSRKRLALEKGDGKDFRFYQPEGTTTLPYGLWKLRNYNKDYLVIVEGESDCHTLWQHKIQALGVAGATNWKAKYDNFLSGFKKIYLIKEPDKGGEDFVASFRRLSKKRYITSEISLKPHKDASAVHLSEEKDFVGFLMRKIQESKLIAEKWSIDLQELLVKDIKPVSYICDKLIMREGLNFWIGDEGSYKTWSLLQLIIAMGTGEMEIWGGLKINPVNVLYMEQDNGLSVMKERFKMLLKDKKLLPDWKLELASYSEKVFIEENVNEIIDFCKEQNIGIVVLDSFRDFLVGDENNSEHVGLFARFAARMKNNGITVQIIHHNGKPTEFGGKYRGRGSSVIFQKADSVVYFTVVDKDKVPDVVVIHQTKLKGDPKLTPDIKLRFEVSEDHRTWARMQYVGKADVELEKEMNDLEKKILQIVEESPTALSVSAIENIVKQKGIWGTSGASIRRILDSLAQHGYVTEYKNSRPFLYGIANLNEEVAIEQAGLLEGGEINESEI